jgi:hypothetical protein
MANRLLKQFTFQELTQEQKDLVTEVRNLFNEFAQDLDSRLPENAEKTVALRKLRESKDDAVLAVIFPEG